MTGIDPEHEKAWHKRFAVHAYNRAWELMDAPGRSPAADAEMLAAALASRFHWGAVGGPVEHATGDWHVARAFAIAGYGAAAIRFATSALEQVDAAREMPDFMRASCLEGLARAHAAAGDAAERDRYLALAREALGAIADEDDRAEIARQIDSVS